MRMKNIMEKYDIRHVITLPYNPRANGISERFNRSILQVCRISKGKNFKKLEVNIFIFLNFNANRKLMMSPIEIINEHSPFDIYKQNLSTEVDKIKREEIDKALEEIKRENIRYKIKRFIIGDLALKRKHFPDKLADKWERPYEICKVIESDRSVFLREMNKMTKKT
ncbi:hypothetical protein DMUE_2076 [Dictyocoela muelleri]|nr:hypothetical protein DMUE_2076 [Dictyocoela muelleri]